MDWSDSVLLRAQLGEPPKRWQVNSSPRRRPRSMRLSRTLRRFRTGSSPTTTTTHQIRPRTRCHWSRTHSSRQLTSPRPNRRPRGTFSRTWSATRILAGASRFLAVTSRFRRNLYTQARSEISGTFPYTETSCNGPTPLFRRQRPAIPAEVVDPPKDRATPGEPPADLGTLEAPARHLGALHRAGRVRGLPPRLDLHLRGRRLREQRVRLLRHRGPHRQ